MRFNIANMGLIQSYSTCVLRRKMFFTIQDHGEGMDQEQLAHVREAFARYKSMLKETSVGLGLFIADAIVKAMQGDLHMSSHKGKGTIVHITVPYVCGVNETLPRVYHPSKVDLFLLCLPMLMVLTVHVGYIG